MIIASQYAALPMRAAVIRIAALMALPGLLLTGCGGGGGGKQQASAPGCERVSPPAPREVHLQAPKQTVRPGEKLTAVVKTSCGSFDIALDTQRAPKTVNSFVYLARKGFYDGLAFWRIAPNYVIQGGDPLGDGTGGPGYHVDEKPPPNLVYTKGVVAMAKTRVEPPGRSGSQFFIVTAADAGLSPDSALVGRVDKGIDVVERIGGLGRHSGHPTQTVLTDQITIQHG
ncbi:MAG: peptidylprolyl isomerase [Actinomycetota bacterium]|nr:peptidylprolyl isomerase [Actinomycetota bacterium]